jgi:hypothetical protein
VQICVWLSVGEETALSPSAFDRLICSRTSRQGA